VCRLERGKDKFIFCKRGAGKVSGLVMVSLKCSWAR